MSRKTLQLPDYVQEYLLQTVVDEPPVLSRLREETARLPMARMQIAPEQGQLMGFLVRLIGARRALEVGVFTGYSALATILAMPPDGRLVGCDISEEWTAIARRYWQQAGVAERMELRLGPALESLATLERESGADTFDFAFIDADKENYQGYFEHCLRLVRPGGLIAIDNTLWSGRVAQPDANDTDTRAIREFNASLFADDRVDATLVPIADGLALAHVKE